MKALLIDGLNLVRRVFAAVPGDQETIEHFEGALDSTLQSLRRALNELMPTHAVCVFDGDGLTWRHALFPDYKKDRPPMPDTLQTNLHQVRSAIEAAGVRTIAVEGAEADDVIATIAVKIAARDGRVVALSTDKSMCQLISDRIQVRDHFGSRYLDRAYVKQRFGASPSQLPLLLGLIGDKSLNIPGVTSIGARTAAALVSQFSSVEDLLSSAETIPGRPGKALQAEADNARLSVTLMTLKTDIEIGINLSELRVPDRADD